MIFFFFVCELFTWIVVDGLKKMLCAIGVCVWVCVENDKKKREKKTTKNFIYLIRGYIWEFDQN